MWLPKVALGGLLGSSMFGVIWPQGLVIEHLDNSSRGYRLPLPAWRQFGDKAVMGLLATVMDFVYFIFPQLVAATFLFCAILPFIVGDNNSIATSITLIIFGTLFGVSFLGSFSPVSKLFFCPRWGCRKSLRSRQFSASAWQQWSLGLFQCAVSDLASISTSNGSSLVALAIDPYSSSGGVVAAGGIMALDELSVLGLVDCGSSLF